MDAVVFTSNTGFTEQYARMLGNETGLPVYTLAEASDKLPKGSSVIYLGWLMAGTIKGLKKARRLFGLCAVCAVGINASDAQKRQAQKKGDLANTPFFLMQGGFDIDRLHGIYKVMMQMMKKFGGKKLEQKTDRTPDESDMLDLLKNGGSRVSAENLSPVISWWNENKNL